MAEKSITKLSNEVDNRLYLIGMTRKELAKKMGIHHMYLCMILRGKNRLSIPQSRIVAECINVNERILRQLSLEAWNERKGRAV